MNYSVLRSFRSGSRAYSPGDTIRGDQLPNHAVSLLAQGFLKKVEPAPRLVPATPIALIDLNLAEAEILATLSHVGETRASEIISLRPFASVDEAIETLTYLRFSRQKLSCSVLPITGIDSEEIR